MPAHRRRPAQRAARRVVALAVLLAVLVPGVASAGWQQVGGALNGPPANGASWISVAGVGGVPYVTWNDSRRRPGTVQAKVFSGGQWNALPSFMKPGGSAASGGADIIDFNGEPRWSRGSRRRRATPFQVYVSRFVQRRVGRWAARSTGRPSTTRSCPASRAAADHLRRVGRGASPTSTARSASRVERIGLDPARRGAPLRSRPDRARRRGCSRRASGVVGVVWAEAFDDSYSRRLHAATWDGSNWMPLGRGREPDHAHARRRSPARAT